MPVNRISSIPDLARAVAQFVAENLPGRVPTDFEILFTAGRPLSVPLTLPAPVPPAERAPRLKDIQADVINTLAELPVGRGMSLDTLAAKLERDRSHLHRDGVKPLVKMGLIVNDAAKGGYMLTDDGADWSED